MSRPGNTTKLLLRRLGASRRLIYVLDERRRFVYCNAACAQWLHRRAEELVGQRCDYHSQSEAGDLAVAAAGLCPPPEVFSGKRMRGVVRAIGADGSVSRRRAEFLPLPTADDAFGGAIAFVEEQDLTENESSAELDSSPAALHERLSAFRRRLGARYGLARFAGDSPSARRLRAQAAMAQRTPGRVVIVGPAGSGRELLAKAIHYHRAASPGMLVPIDCAIADSETLQSSIAAFKRKTADSGLEATSSLLLLNVDELPPSGQDELAGFLSLPAFELNTLATSRRALAAAASEGRFRGDLAISLTSLAIEILPLVERPEDIPLMAQYFLEEMNAAGGRQFSGWSEDALDRLAGYHWPGDVAELAAVVQQACQAAEGPLVKETDLPARLRLAAEAAAHPPRVEQPIVLDAFLAEVEMELIRRALALSQGNKAKAARLLGVSRQRIISRLASPPTGPAQQETAPWDNGDDDRETPPSEPGANDS